MSQREASERSWARRAGLRRLALGLTFLACCVAWPGLAQERGQVVPPDLLQKAWTQGTVRVIVELGGTGVLLEGRLFGTAAVAAQRRRIASERGTLLAGLRGLRHRILREFKSIPYVGLEVDYATLQVLNSLPGLATRVQEDLLLRPMLVQSGPLITFAAGVVSQTVEIPLLPRDGDQGPRAFRVRLHDPAGGGALGSLSTAIVWTLD